MHRGIIASLHQLKRHPRSYREHRVAHLFSGWVLGQTNKRSLLLRCVLEGFLDLHLDFRIAQHFLCFLDGVVKALLESFVHLD